MSVVLEHGKRITFKRTRPNPLFYYWLQELYKEAKQKGSKLEPMLKEALESITKYPLPLESGAECALLKGFDKRLCLFLDKRLEVYKNNKRELDAYSVSTDSSTSDEEDNVEPNRPSDKNDIKQNRIYEVNDVKPNRLTEGNDLETNRLCEENQIGPNSFCENKASKKYDVKSSKSNTNPEPSTSFVPKTSPIRNGKKRKYIPEFRSASYALLMALADIGKSNTIMKQQLIISAQKYSDGDITNEWKNMTQLIKKGLIHKKTKNKKILFCLTDDGFSVVKELHHHAQKKIALDNSNNINNQGNIESDANDLLYDNNEYTSKVASTNNKKTNLISNGVFCDKNNKESQVSSINNGLIIRNDANNDIKAANTFIRVDTKTTSLDNNINSDVIKDEVDYSSLIELEPDSYDIILLIDKNETCGVTKKNKPTVTLFNKYPELKHEYRSLKVGDFTWVARSKRSKDEELVLPYVVERKRMDDFGSSIKDGRFHEQKFRLRKCGLNHVIYLVENHGSNKHVGMPMQSLMQALANTSVQDEFKVHVTESLKHSVQFLIIMTLRLMYEYKNKTLKGHSAEPNAEILMTFGYFNKSSVKNRPLSVTDTFIKLLLQLKGISVEKALTITNVYKTPRSLIDKYKNCDQKEGEMLLANLKFGKQNRSVGPGISKSIYQLFTFRTVK